MTVFVDLRFCCDFLEALTYILSRETVSLTDQYILVALKLHLASVILSLSVNSIDRSRMVQELPT